MEMVVLLDLVHWPNQCMVAQPMYDARPSVACALVVETHASVCCVCIGGRVETHAAVTCFSHMTCFSDMLQSTLFLTLSLRIEMYRSVSEYETAFSILKSLARVDNLSPRLSLT